MTSISEDKILLIYNADEGWLSQLQDAAHKIMRPESYPCSLCMISYGSVAMKRRWRKFLEDLPLQAEFFHRQDFARAYPDLATVPLPAILLERSGEVVSLLNAEQLDSLENLDGLIDACEIALAEVQPVRSTPALSSSG